MLKLLVLVTLLSSSLCLNPGLYGFVSRKSLIDFKDSAWPKVKELLSNIQIPEQQNIDVEVGQIELTNLHVQINLESNGVDLFLDGGSNQVKVSANNVSFSGGGHWIYRNFIYSPDGDMTFNGSIASIQANINIDNQIKGDGLVPKIVFDNIILLDVNNLDINTTNSGMAPFYNIVLDGQSGIIANQIQQQLSNDGSIKNNLSNLINQGILDNYPVAIPIEKYGIAVSTYTTGPIKIYNNNGFEIPVEGFTYAIKSGYKKNLFCKEMHSYINPDIVISDFYAAAGECTLQSGADAQTEAGFKYEFKQSTPIGEIHAIVQLKRWDGQSFEFHQDNVKANVLIEVTGYMTNGSVMHDFTITANAVANVKLTKVSSPNQVRAQRPELTGGNLATIAVFAKIESLDDFKVIGVFATWADAIKSSLLQKDFTTTFNIPQFCIADKVCFNSFNAGAKEGFILADATVDYRPLREEPL